MYSYTNAGDFRPILIYLSLEVVESRQCGGRNFVVAYLRYFVQHYKVKEGLLLMVAGMIITV
jgi:hypothetical protein